VFRNEDDFIQLLYHCLLALKEIHEMGIVHGDFKADNICIARHSTQDKSDLRYLKIIDFAFSLSRDNHLRFVLPIDPERIDYLPEFYKNAIRKAQSSKQPSIIQAACCPEVDLYSLGVMMEKCVQLVRPIESRYWTRLLDLVYHCKQVGARKPSRVHLWWRKNFAQPTINAMSKVEKLLRPEPPSPQELTSVITSLRTPMASTRPPIFTPLNTQLALDRVIDPSLSSAVSSKDLSSSTDLKTRNSTVTKKKQKGLWFWLAGTVLLFFLIYRINYIYERDNLIISDTGYYLGVVANGIAPLLLWRVSQIMLKPRLHFDRLLFILLCWLYATSLYFLVTIKSKRGSWFDLLF
jgi:serine/threonine protein kinase